MNTCIVYTFKGEPNMLVTVAGQNEALFRFDKKGRYKMISDGTPHIEKLIKRLCKRFEFTKEEYRLVKVNTKGVAKQTAPKTKPKGEATK